MSRAKNDPSASIPSASSIEPLPASTFAKMCDELPTSIDDGSVDRNGDVVGSRRPNGRRGKAREHGKRERRDLRSADGSLIHEGVVVRVAAGYRALIEIDRGRGDLESGRRARVLVERQRLLAVHGAAGVVIDDHVAGIDDHALIELDAVLREEHGVRDSGRDRRTRIVRKQRGRDEDTNRKGGRNEQTKLHAALRFRSDAGELLSGLDHQYTLGS